MELKKKVIECKCKLPQDAAVEVKRTPSLAALCQCTPEDKLMVKSNYINLSIKLKQNIKNVQNKVFISSYFTLSDFHLKTRICNFQKSCSCTSLSSQLLSNLLADLFGGLQSELSGTGSIMPCQMLKCLEDKHNWERSSVIKTNLFNFFAQLLIGELDIAIATSIEKYHAKVSIILLYINTNYNLCLTIQYFLQKIFWCVSIFF